MKFDNLIINNFDFICKPNSFLKTFLQKWNLFEKTNLEKPLED